MLLAASLLLKVLAIPLFARIAWRDFATQKISNRDVLLLLCLGIASMQFMSIQAGSWWDMGLSIITGFVLLVVLFPFWVLRKVGAGDVKLIAVVPFLTGGTDLVVFTLLLLVFALITAAVVKNPFMLPEGAFRLYAEHLDRKGVVPFGVPISIAAICSIIFHIVSRLMGYGGIETLF
jgi:prepilin peptidase CpaA